MPNFDISFTETFKHLQVVLYDNMNEKNSFWNPKTVQQSIYEQILIILCLSLICSPTSNLTSSLTKIYLVDTTSIISNRSRLKRPHIVVIWLKREQIVITIYFLLKFPPQVIILEYQIESIITQNSPSLDYLEV